MKMETLKCAVIKAFQENPGFFFNRERRHRIITYFIKCFNSYVLSIALDTLFTGKDRRVSLNEQVNPNPLLYGYLEEYLFNYSRTFDSSRNLCSAIRNMEISLFYRSLFFIYLLENIKIKKLLKTDPPLLTKNSEYKRSVQIMQKLRDMIFNTRLTKTWCVLKTHLTDIMNGLILYRQLSVHEVDNLLITTYNSLFSTKRLEEYIRITSGKILQINPWKISSKKCNYNNFNKNLAILKTNGFALKFSPNEAYSIKENTLKLLWETICRSLPKIKTLKIVGIVVLFCETMRRKCYKENVIRNCTNSEKDISVSRRSQIVKCTNTNSHVEINSVSLSCNSPVSENCVKLIDRVEYSTFFTSSVKQAASKASCNLVSVQEMIIRYSSDKSYELPGESKAVEEAETFNSVEGSKSNHPQDGVTCGPVQQSLSLGRKHFNQLAATPVEDVLKCTELNSTSLDNSYQNSGKQSSQLSEKIDLNLELELNDNQNIPLDLSLKKNKCYELYDNTDCSKDSEPSEESITISDHCDYSQLFYTCSIVKNNQSEQGFRCYENVALPATDDSKPTCNEESPSRNVNSFDKTIPSNDSCYASLQPSSHESLGDRQCDVELNRKGLYNEESEEMVDFTKPDSISEENEVDKSVHKCPLFDALANIRNIDEKNSETYSTHNIDTVAGSKDQKSLNNNETDKINTEMTECSSNFAIHNEAEVNLFVSLRYENPSKNTETITINQSDVEVTGEINDDLITFKLEETYKQESEYLSRKVQNTLDSRQEKDKTIKSDKVTIGSRDKPEDQVTPYCELNEKVDSVRQKNDISGILSTCQKVQINLLEPNMPKPKFTTDKQDISETIHESIRCSDDELINANNKLSPVESILFKKTKQRDDEIQYNVDSKLYRSNNLIKSNSSVVDKCGEKNSTDEQSKGNNGTNKLFRREKSKDESIFSDFNQSSESEDFSSIVAKLYEEDTGSAVPPSATCLQSRERKNKFDDLVEAQLQKHAQTTSKILEEENAKKEKSNPFDFIKTSLSLSSGYEGHQESANTDSNWLDSWDSENLPDSQQKYSVVFAKNKQSLYVLPSTYCREGKIERPSPLTGPANRFQPHNIGSNFGWTDSLHSKNSPWSYFHYQRHPSYDVPTTSREDTSLQLHPDESTLHFKSQNSSPSPCNFETSTSSHRDQIQTQANVAISSSCSHVKQYSRCFINDAYQPVLPSGFSNPTGYPSENSPLSHPNQISYPHPNSYKFHHQYPQLYYQVPYHNGVPFVCSTNTPSISKSSCHLGPINYFDNRTWNQNSTGSPHPPRASVASFSSCFPPASNFLHSNYSAFPVLRQDLHIDCGGHNSQSYPSQLFNNYLQRHTSNHSYGTQPQNINLIPTHSDSGKLCDKTTFKRKFKMKHLMGQSEIDPKISVEEIPVAPTISSPEIREILDTFLENDSRCQPIPSSLPPKDNFISEQSPPSTPTISSSNSPKAATYNPNTQQHPESSSFSNTLFQQNEHSEPSKFPNPPSPPPYAYPESRPHYFPPEDQIPPDQGEAEIRYVIIDALSKNVIFQKSVYQICMYFGVPIEEVSQVVTEIIIKVRLGKVKIRHRDEMMLMIEMFINWVEGEEELSQSQMVATLLPLSILVFISLAWNLKWGVESTRPLCIELMATHLNFLKESKKLSPIKTFILSLAFIAIHPVPVIINIGRTSCFSEVYFCLLIKVLLDLIIYVPDIIVFQGQSIYNFIMDIVEAIRVGILDSSKSQYDCFLLSEFLILPTFSSRIESAEALLHRFFLHPDS